MADATKSTTTKMHGEGNPEADRKYREAASRHAASGQVEREARDAEDALEVDEREELEEAERTGKSHAQGPASR